MIKVQIDIPNACIGCGHEAAALVAALLTEAGFDVDAATNETRIRSSETGQLETHEIFPVQATTLIKAQKANSLYRRRQFLRCEEKLTCRVSAIREVQS